MINIRPIKPDEATTAKRVIYRVAHEIFRDPRTLEESIVYHESRGELEDMDNIRQLQDKICELKRLWLLTEYHHKGLGYRMLQELLAVARGMGYERIRLETDPEVQIRAVDFYKRNGFYEIQSYSDHTGEVAMEIIL
jgi:putative acetyltransferase